MPKEKKQKLQPPQNTTSDKLTVAELQTISQVLYLSKWSGEEWSRVFTPLINKLARMIDNLTEDPKKDTNK